MRYPQKPFVEAILISILLMSSAPKAAFSHVGHGDEFQATGGIERVQANPETDQQMGIVVSPIEKAAPNGGGVMIPATALVDSDGKQLVFVQYDNFYEPVEVTTGGTQDDLIEVTQGLSVGEQLVTQGSLSLYAQSRKTPTADTSASSTSSPAAVASPQTNSVDPQTTATVDSQSAPQQASGLPMGILGIAAGGVVLLISSIAILAANRKKKSNFSDDKGGY
jgi:cation efflux system membrane fusion protein